MNREAFARAVPWLLLAAGAISFLTAVPFPSSGPHGEPGTTVSPLAFFALTGAGVAAAVWCVFARGVERAWTTREVWLCAVGLLLLFGRPLVQPSIRFDGSFYYAPARSIVFDGNLDYRNELVLMPELVGFAKATGDGPVGLPFSCGPALLWLPGTALLKAIGAGATGLEMPYRAHVSLVSLAVCAGGMLALLHAVGGLFANPRARARGQLTATLFVLATMVPFFTFFEVSLSHAYQFAACAWLLSVSMRLRNRRTLALAAEAGGAVAACFLVRWNDVLGGVLPLVTMMTARLRSEEDAPPPAQLPLALAMFAGVALLGTLPQLIVWKATYGAWVTLPQGSGFVDLARPHLAGLLFSTWNGLFVHHPVFFLGVVAMVFVLRDRSLRMLSLPMAVTIGATVWVCASVSDWWAGSFGARRLTNLVPLLALAAGWCVARSDRPIAWIAPLLALLAWNFGVGGASAHVRLPIYPSEAYHYMFTSDPSRPYGHWEYGRFFGDAARGAGYYLRR